MSNLRTGTYGSYYGSYKGQSTPLTKSQMSVNATYIYKALTAKGWTINAVSALLGNMQAESSINPGRWQSEDVGNTSMGYGMVQWTPATKYINWCSDNGYIDYSEMDSNIARILYELENNVQWIATSSYNFSFKEFSKSNKAPSYLAVSFLLNYERPADQSSTVQKYRGELANSWYTYLTGVEPEQPSLTTKRKKRYNFILFNRRKRQWTNRNFLNR